ncbi:MAG: hypothetical protein WA510_20170 [Acidobacteriaceae bacterium]
MADRIVRALLPLASFCFAILLGLPGAGWVPDAGQYRLLALGPGGAVPAPFSARILSPAIAGFLGRITGRGVDAGFLVLGIVCLIALLVLMARLLQLLQTPTVIFAAIFLMPFWVDIFHDYYLPDPLHAAILAAMLLCLLLGHSGWALLLLLPAYLARESTSLVAVCLLVACWRRVPLRSALIGVGALVCAAAVSRHYGQGGPVNVHQMTGGSYVLGKVVWSFFKNVLGFPLWSNTLPECTPLRVMAVPFGLHLGAIREVGVCPPSAWGPARVLLAWFGLFGIGPALALAQWRLSPWRRMTALASADKQLPGEIAVLRFCVLYGLISILITPLLGASVDRLVEYGWPFYFIVLPWFLSRVYDLRGRRAAGLCVLHLLTCWLAWFGFRQLTPGHLFVGLTVLVLNGVAYGLLRRASLSRKDWPEPARL